MNRGRNIILITLGILIILIIVYLTTIRSVTPNYNWTEHYEEASKQPLGTSVVSTLLEGYFENFEFSKVNNNLAEHLLESQGAHNNYIFIGDYPYFTDSIFKLLKYFVSNGNDAFLALHNMPIQLSEEILLQSSSNYLILDTVYYFDNFGDSSFYIEENYASDPITFSEFRNQEMTLNFFAYTFKREIPYSYEIIIKEEPVYYSWLYFYPQYQNKIVEHTPLGSIYSDNFTDFIQVPYGRGYFYIHCNPIVFSNYFQIKEDNLEYTSKVFSYLKPGNIIWDEHSKTYYNDRNLNNDPQSEGPLRFILSQTSLRWAWYLMLATLFVFILFRAKRMQQHIPVLEPNENKSLEFVQTIGRMYYLRRNHKQLAQQKMKLFLHFIFERYQLSTHTTDEDFIQKLNMKSEIGSSHIQSIFKHQKYIENTNEVTDQDLIQMHSLLDYFYKNCK